MPLLYGLGQTGAELGQGAGKSQGLLSIFVPTPLTLGEGVSVVELRETYTDG